METEELISQASSHKAKEDCKAGINSVYVSIESYTFTLLRTVTFLYEEPQKKDFCDLKKKCSAL